MKAICIQCGTSKEAPWHKCQQCGFIPEGDDLVKSTYCSVWRFAGDPDLGNEYGNELHQMSLVVRAHHQLVFDEAELNRLRELITFVESGSPGVYGALFRTFLPAIAFLAILYTIVWWLGK